MARDGEEALDFIFATGRYAHRARIWHLEMILLDLDLPNKSGLEVLRKVKTDKRTRDIPVIMLMEAKQDRDISECRRLGADFHIVKPVGFENFSEATRQFRFDWVLVNSPFGKREGETESSQAI